MLLDLKGPVWSITSYLSPITICLTFYFWFGGGAGPAVPGGLVVGVGANSVSLSFETVKIFPLGSKPRPLIIVYDTGYSFKEVIIQKL